MKDAVCDLCNQQLSMYHAGNSAFFRCHHCKISLSLRRSSIFQYSLLPTVAIVKIIFYHLIREKISLDVGVSRKAVRKFLKHIRRHIARFILKSYIEDDMLGTENEPGRRDPTVEVDETKVIM